MGIDSAVFKDDYSNDDWECLRNDSARMNEVVRNLDVIEISTPGMGLGDDYMVSPVIRAIDEYYHPADIIVNTYHPYLFEDNPRCTPGTDVHSDRNITMHTWPYRCLPNGGYMGDGPRISVPHQHNIRVGIWGSHVNTKHEFYPTMEEVIWGTRLEEYKPYIVVQAQCDPPRRYYNISPNLPRSDSMDRWMTIGDWHDDRWTTIVSAMNDTGYNVVQIGCEYEELIPECIDMRHVGPRRTFIVVGHGDLLICHESFPQFTADAMDVPSLVMMTGRSCADGQQLRNRTTIDFSDGLPCAPCWNIARNVDEYCPGTCMDRITASVVIDNALGILEV